MSFATFKRIINGWGYRISEIGLYETDQTAQHFACNKTDCSVVVSTEDDVMSG
jgi:hypothetical protein